MRDGKTSGIARLRGGRDRDFKNVDDDRSRGASAVLTEVSESGQLPPAFSTVHAEVRRRSPGTVAEASPPLQPARMQRQSPEFRKEKADD